ncbi:hypothetical protein [Clostridium tarantellae]|uniref:Uncharacterized protein n=1 Tax=Clostridium tarantellae TaxID=39493 RepID=A0A6I1MUU3_9CLOT|nr:hypothetical protein [Clostridium tarantellae]MPQ44611.1 hypothetical protein [Clostridium tarantellae]
MKKISLIIKNLLLIFWWQDIEKSNIFVRILNYIFAFSLSFGSFSLVILSNINIILKIILGIYLIINIISFWPVSHLLEQKDKFKGSMFFIFQNNCILFSFIILLNYIIKKEEKNDFENKIN